MDLSRIQSRLGNSAFLDRRDVEPENVGGFGVGMARTTESEASWTVTLRGATSPGAPPVNFQVVCTFNEIRGL
eukprot:9096926-Lingulodinium_polyedra.AAC.1